MSHSPTFPSLYRYGFLTSRAADLLSRADGTQGTEQQREVFSACRDLVKKIMLGEKFLIGSNPEEVHNLRPEDVEIFTYVLDRDSMVKSLAGSQESLRRHLEGILGTFESLIADPPRQVKEQDLQTTLNFLTTIADSLIESARENLGRGQADEPAPAVNE